MEAAVWGSDERWHADAVEQELTADPAGLAIFVAEVDDVVVSAGWVRFRAPPTSRPCGAARRSPRGAGAGSRALVSAARSSQPNGGGTSRGGRLVGQPADSRAARLPGRHADAAVRLVAARPPCREGLESIELSTRRQLCRSHESSPSKASTATGWPTCSARWRAANGRTTCPQGDCRPARRGGSEVARRRVLRHGGGYRRGDAALNAMPAGDTPGRRARSRSTTSRFA